MGGLAWGAHPCMPWQSGEKTEAGDKLREMLHVKVNLRVRMPAGVVYANSYALRTCLGICFARRK